MKQTTTNKLKKRTAVLIGVEQTAALVEVERIDNLDQFDLEHRQSLVKYHELNNTIHQRALSGSVEALCFRFTQICDTA